MKAIKYFSLVFSFAFMLAGTILLSGCNASAFDTDKLTIVDEFTYDGNSHILEISYEDVDLNITYCDTKDGEFESASEFNFVNADTYELYYKISAEGFLDYQSSEPRRFEINKRNITIDVQDVAKLVSDKDSQGYATIAPTTNVDDVVIGEDELNLSFSIGSKIGTQNAFVANNVRAGEKYNIVSSYNNDNYNVTFNNGFVEIKDFVEIAKKNGDKIYYPTLDKTTIYSDIDKGSIITLYKDFAYENEEAIEYDIRLKAENDTDYEFTFDLNGHSVDYRMTFTNWISGSNYTTGKINVTIKNGSLGNLDTTGYGMTVFGNEEVTVTLENLKLAGKSYGFSGNGYCGGASITATNCEFTGIEAGFYAPSLYTYEFENCKFVGNTGYYAKSGNHIFNNCDFIGNKTEYKTPTYNGSGTYSTGSAIVIDSAQGYLRPMEVELNKCTFDSIVGYCIEEFSTAGSAQEECYAQITVVDANYIRLGQTKAVFSENYPTDPEILQGVLPKNLLTPSQSE